MCELSTRIGIDFRFQTLFRKTGHKARMSYKAGITALPEKQKNVALMTKLTESQTHTHTQSRTMRGIQQQLLSCTQKH